MATAPLLVKAIVYTIVSPGLAAALSKAATRIKPPAVGPGRVG